MSRASKKLIISTEEIISTDEIRKNPDRTLIPYFLVDAVVHAPFSSHPGEMNYVHERDEEGLKEWIDATQTPEAARAYLEKYVYGVRNHEEYLDLIGHERLRELKEKCKGR